MKNFKKGFAPLVLLLIIAALAIGGGAYYYSQKVKNSTKQLAFTTYTSKLGFSIDYPQDWTVTPQKGEDFSLGGVTFAHDQAQEIQIELDYIDLSNTKSTTNTSSYLTYATEHEIANIKESKQTILESKQIIIDSKPASIIKYKNNSSTGFIYLLLAKQSPNLKYTALIYLNYSAPTSEYSEDLENTLQTSFKENIMQTIENKTLNAAK